jgi:hypothetical protein
VSEGERLFACDGVRGFDVTHQHCGGMSAAERACVLDAAEQRQRRAGQFNGVGIAAEQDLDAAFGDRIETTDQCRIDQCHVARRE